MGRKKLEQIQRIANPRRKQIHQEPCRKKNSLLGTIDHKEILGQIAIRSSPDPWIAQPLMLSRTSVSSSNGIPNPAATAKLAELPFDPRI